MTKSRSFNYFTTMTTTMTKNGVNTLSPHEIKREKILKNLEVWKSILPIYVPPYWDKERKEIQEFINKLERELKRMEQEKETTSPIKNYLLKHSRLVQFKEKEASGKSLTKAEEAQENRIYELRDKVFNNIKKELVKYYQAASKGDYRYGGMPEIKGGIRDWAEDKIWRLLVSLGEPNNLRYAGKNEDDYWAEKE